ncbi:oxidoreductase [Acinetobacter sp. NCu2D-2]|uniref:ferredoxin reductase n=1 Tax=Acinetobacter sp. NCu2D-2 TaxID=1608473 RepID=UPI0007CE0AF9|nr:ferredoxin reductase [Acinetobacter sp. NCu2D-2]ANF81581.1 oxidoreductase [Acinetobacter sp. NCu2D-2]
MNAIAKLKKPFDALTESVVDQYAINFWIQKLNPLWSVNQPLGKIVHKEVTATDTISLKIQVNRLFKFGEAGQHHPVYVVVNGIRYERSYSLTQLDDQHVLLTVKKVNKGKISNWFANTAKTGDIIEFGQPFGDMTLPQDASPLLLLAAGSGITPMLSLLTELNKQNGFNRPVQLWYWVKNNQDAAFVARFQQIADKHADFSFKVFATQAEQPAERINASYLDNTQNLEQTTVYACGPSGFVSTVEEICSAAKAVKTEAFSMSLVDQSEIGFVNIILTKTNKTVTIPKGQSILSSLEQQNIKPNHGCRMGICNKCACNKVEGSTKNLVNGAQNAEPGNLLKICVNSAQTDLVIDL